MRTYIITLCAIITTAFASCDKGDMEIKKLNKGEGTWTIEKLVVEEYDSTGTNVISTVSQTDLGEFVFFQETTLYALYDEHFVTALIPDTAGVISGYTGGVYYDDNRVKIDCSPAPFVMNGSVSLNGVWTVEDNGRKSQTWIMHQLNNNELKWKLTLDIKKK